MYKNLKTPFLKQTAFGLLILGSLTLTLAHGEQAKLVRVPLQTHDLSTPEKVVVQVRAEFPESAAAGRHTHPGEEIGYILEGQLELRVDGQPTRILKAGDVFFIPPGVIHDGINTGSGMTKVLATYVVEKGKPVATLIPN